MSEFKTDAMNNIDIEQLMAQIRRDISAKGYKPEQLSFKDPEAVAEEKMKEQKRKREHANLEREMQYLSSHYEVQPYSIITGNKIKVFIKRVIRKSVAFFFLPVIKQQNEVNYSYFAILSELNKQKADNSELLNRVQNIEEQISELEKRTASNCNPSEDRK